MNLNIFQSFAFLLFCLKAVLGQIFVTPNQTCGINCIGNLTDPFDNLLFALQYASVVKAPVTITLLGNSSSKHYMLPREQSQQDPSTLLYNFSEPIGFTLEDVEIKPLFCGEEIVQNNSNLVDKCIDRSQNLTIVFKPMEITLTIMSRLSIQNIIFDWSESSKSVNRSDGCSKVRARCCNTKEIIGKIDCDPKFYAKQPLNRTSTFNFIELGPKRNATKYLSFNYVTFKSFRDKTLRSFLRTNGNDPFDLVFQNCLVDDVTFGQGLITHIGTGNETFNSSIKFVNFTFSKYNYWNRDDEPNYKTWNEGYLFWGDTNFKGSFMIFNSTFMDLNAASMYKCDISDPIMSNNLKTYTVSRSDIWSRYHARNSTQESSIIYIKRLDGEMTIQRSLFQKIIGLYGSVVQVTDCSDATRFSFLDDKFDGNFGMQGFANILVVAKPLRKDGRCPSFEIQNSEFSNSRGCLGSYGNVGYICYWDKTPSTTSGLLSYNYLFNSAFKDIFKTLKSVGVQISGSKFQNNIIAISNSLAIIGSYISILENNTFQENGGTSAQIMNYSLENTNFMEKKPKQSISSSSFLGIFGQSCVVYFDRIAKLQSKGNLFQGNWGPWEGSQVLAVAITVRNSLPIGAGFLTFQDDLFANHFGIPPHVANYLVSRGLYLKNNSYIPPLVTFCYDIDGSSNFIIGEDAPYIVFDRVEFRNNTARFNYTDACLYNPYGLDSVCFIMQNKTRYLTGLVKYLSEAELREESSTDSIAINRMIKMSLSMMNTKITNNLLLTEGCFFSTVWTERYFLTNLTIRGNKINPYANYFSEFSTANEPLLDSSLKNRGGIFCVYLEKTLANNNFKVFVPSIRMTNDLKAIVTATNLNVISNTGTVFNLFPQDLSTLFLLNSQFRGNSCPYGPIINIFEKSRLISLNNIFTENDNSLGIIFIASSGTSKQGIFNTYLKNNGKHASLAYIYDKAQLIEIFLKNYWNVVNPSFATFADEITPQGSLYFIQSAQAIFSLSEFKQNNPYSGFVISLKSTLSFSNINISDHNINGNSVIGNIYSSTLEMRRIKIVNNSLISLSYLAKPSIINMEKSQLNADGLEISHTLSHNQGAFLVGTRIKGTLLNLVFNDFHSAEGNALVKLDSSNLTIRNLFCNNISTLFKLSETTLNLEKTLIQNSILVLGSPFLINMIDTNLNIDDFNYTEGTSTGDFFSLIKGSNNRIKIVKANFENAIPGMNKIFDLANSASFFIANSRFIYKENKVQTLIFDLTSTNKVTIQDCLFILTGQITQAHSVLDTFIFVRNTILTNSHIENIKLISGNIALILHNNILRQSIDPRESFSESQLILTNSFGPTLFKSNSFISLYGSKGIIQVQALAASYNISSRDNVFIDNTGIEGGVFHLDTSLPLVLLNLGISKITIQGSIFLLNKAVSFENLKGRGGVIYQTTSMLSKQVTSLEKSLLIGNLAETIGGAIFFDYLPPQVDVDTVFRENYAMQPNNIGSYPVKLVYYGKEIPKKGAYIPSQPHIRENYILNRSLNKWENIPSGIIVDEAYIFGLVDMFDQIVYDDTHSLLELFPEGIKNEERYLFSSKLSIEAKNGLYIFSNFKFSYKINDSIRITFKSSAIDDQKKIPISSDTFITSVSSLQIEVHFRKCQRGEYISRENNITICETCQPGFWQPSIDSNTSFCKPCIDMSTICLGGDNVGPKKGYWRFNESSDIVHPCPITSSCLGNELTGDSENPSLDPVGQCDNGYTGNLCSNCIPGWVKTGNGTCTSCKNDAWFYIRLLLSLGFQLGLIIQGYRETMNLCREYSENRTTNLNGAILLRILTNYLQLISLVSKIPIDWPDFIKNLLSTSSEVSTINEHIFSVDCIFSSGQAFGIKLVFIKLLIESIGGFIIALVSSIFWIIYYKAFKRKAVRSRKYLSTLITTTIVICFLMQPSAVQSSFSLFQCINLYREDTPIYYFSKDYDLVCWEGEHLFWALGLGLPSLIIWALVLPFIIFNTIRKNKNRLKTQEISQKYSFLYGGYKQERYYWELVVMIKKFLFIAIIISASFHSTNLQLYFSILLIIFFYAIHVLGRPFSDSQLDFLERISLMSAGAINFCGLYFQLISSAPPVLDIIFILIGFIAYLIFLIAFIGFYFNIQIKKLQENSRMYGILIKIILKFNCCLKHINSLKSTIILQAKERKESTTIQTDEMANLRSEGQSDRPLCQLAKRQGEKALDRAFSSDGSQVLNSPHILSFEEAYINEERKDEDQLELRSLQTKKLSLQQVYKLNLDN